MPEVAEFFEAVKAGDRQKVIQFAASMPHVLSARDGNGSSGVQLACYYGHPEIGELLAARGEQLDIWDASTVGEIDVVRSWILGRVQTVNECSQDGFLPLCLASAFGHAEIVETLIEAGANPNLRSKALGRVAPLDSAVFAKNARIVDVLLRAGADPNSPQDGGFYPLHGAAQNGDVALIQILRQAGAKVTVTTDEGKTPADLAIAGGHAAAVDALA